MLEIGKRVVGSVERGLNGVRYGMVWNGLTWHGMAWRGMVTWCGVVWWSR